MYIPLIGIFLAIHHEHRGNAEIKSQLSRSVLHPAALHNLRLIALGSGRADASVPHFERALTLNPRYSEAANNLGVAHLQSGRLAEARTAFARAVALDPRNVQARRNLASFTGGG